MGPDFVFPSQDAFRDRLAEREAADTAELESKLGRKWVATLHTVPWRGNMVLRMCLRNVLQYTPGTTCVQQSALRMIACHGYNLQATRSNPATLQPRLNRSERDHIGVGALRRYLEHLLQVSRVVRQG